MEIVKASKRELNDIVVLNSDVQTIHHNQHPDIFKLAGEDLELREFFESIISEENNYLFIAYIEGKAAGYIWAKLEEKPSSALKYERRHIYIHQLAVHEKYRKQDIGKSLFEKVEFLAVDLGIEHFELDSWAFNVDAHKFFNKLGFETYNVKMWRKPSQST